MRSAGDDALLAVAGRGRGALRSGPCPDHPPGQVRGGTNAVGVKRRKGSEDPAQLFRPRPVPTRALPAEDAERRRELGNHLSRHVCVPHRLGTRRCHRSADAPTDWPVGREHSKAWIIMAIARCQHLQQCSARFGFVPHRLWT